MKIKMNMPKNGDVRTVKHFCLFPYKHNGYWFWLETVEIQERYLDFGGESFWVKIN